MDIHRIRYVPYNPAPINCVAFSQSVASKKNGPVRLAIGRASGDIEIWCPLNGSWHQETIIRGGKNRTVDGLVWVTEPDQILPDGKRIPGRLRLFSFGYSSTVTEWDLEKGRPKHQSSGTHSDIWCLGVQPFIIQGKNGDTSKTKVYHTGKKLVAGTMDGSLVLYDIDDGELRYDRVLARSSSKKIKMVSIAFKDRNTVVVGTSQSCILVYDMRTGATLAKMTLGSDLVSGAKEIIAWCVKCLDGGDIVSGDSTGELRIWDGKTYTQAQRLKAHSSDVLSLVTSADGSTIVTGGMDRRTAVYRKTSGSGSRWAKIFHRRFHHHDVKTMASFEGHGMSVVVSGGPDATPVVMPLQKAGIEEHRTLSSLPQDAPLKGAYNSRLIISWWNREVSIWRLPQSVEGLTDQSNNDQDVTQNRKLIARVLIKGEANITSASINADGSLLVVSTTSDIKAFHLQPRHGTRWDELKISKIEFGERVSALGATKTLISPDSKWLCLVQTGGTVSLLRIRQSSNSSEMTIIHPRAVRLQRIRRQAPKQSTMGGLGGYDRTITQAAFSPDSQMLAVADLAGYIDTWILVDSTNKLQNRARDADKIDEDITSDDDSSDSDDDQDTGMEGVRWRQNPNASLIPRLHAAPTVLSFSDHIPSKPITTENDETDDYILLAITSKPQIVLLHPTLGCITSWSRRNPISRFPSEFRDIRDLVKGALWKGDRVWLYGNTYLFMIDTAQDFNESASDGPSTGSELVAQGRKRKRGPDSGAGNKMKNGAVGPTKVLRHVQGGETEELSTDGPVLDPMDEDAESQDTRDDESDESDDENQSELALLRGTQGKPALESQSSSGPAFWYTFKYRPILGIVPLGDRAEEARNGTSMQVTLASTKPKALEVALVERPLFDVDLPERYSGEGEFQR
ncbi:WD40-repeat-containing domain protein [Xylaria bambusicola]|uniref:WD40-repeat-containing domain protein n=1 Tax=Xylaria bambusicola TaxID=326684 RepID=UPI002007FC1C|nr:WD40-repeat-containing domain protein [Xylaria bambusicola]KAI0506921.1 WD40-repeat-containing domain protein [Xylaria bambusicola]